MEVQVELVIRARCKFFENRRAHIGSSFFDNMLTDALATKEIGRPLQIEI
jgi:hypothetical protein